MRCSCLEARPMWIPRNIKLRLDPKTAPADPRRDAVDELLLQDAYSRRKPVLGICYGLQILNVYRHGTLSAAHRVGSQSRGRKKRSDRTHGRGGYGNEAEPDCRGTRLKRGTTAGLPSR